MRDKLGRFKSGANKAEKHHLWNGDNASYTAKHVWIYRNFGKASKCENPKCQCKNPHHYEWANLSGKYYRDMSDWKQLCVSCHLRMDKRRTGKCKNGHKFTLNNTYTRKNGNRECRICMRINDAKRCPRRKVIK